MSRTGEPAVSVVTTCGQHVTADRLMTHTQTHNHDHSRRRHHDKP
jgi:hypothetical protein